MEWKIYKMQDGSVVACYGMQHDGGVLSPSGIGYTMPCFLHIVKDGSKVKRKQKNL